MLITQISKVDSKDCRRKANLCNLYFPPQCIGGSASLFGGNLCNHNLIYLTEYYEYISQVIWHKTQRN